MMKADGRIAEITILYHEQIDFGLDDKAHAPNLVYHFVREQRGPGMRIRAVDMMGYAVCLVTGGEARFGHLGQQADLRYGSVFFRRHRQPYTFDTADGSGLEIVMAMLDPRIRPLWNRLVPKKLVALDLAHPAKLIGIANHFFELLLHNRQARIEQANAFVPFLLEALLADDIRHFPLLRQGDETAARCLHFLHDNHRRVRSIDEVAKACHISRSQLYAIFRRHEEATPKEYLDRLKAASAGDMLRRTDWTLDRVAAETGYPDAPTFSKAFKRITGQSPSGFRAQAPPWAE